ncbi:MAG: hypothetical protein J5J06_15400 [Phycisphaerae bacterium]|nr:hypothetical protein [Phycisphaerae bacterium]
MDGLPRWGFERGDGLLHLGPGNTVPYSSRSVYAPVWFVLAVGLLPLLLPVALEIRRRRIPPGHCRKCRYDLTGNTSGVCPECGTPIPPGFLSSKSGGSSEVEQDASQLGGGT